MGKHLQTGSLKTINGQSLVGSGDIAISGSGGGTGLLELPAYSTNEVLTSRRWVDGRPIYSKAVKLTSFALTADVWTYAPHGINNLSEITSVSGSYADSSGNIGSFPFLESPPNINTQATPDSSLRSETLNNANQRRQEN